MAYQDGQKWSSYNFLKNMYEGRPVRQYVRDNLLMQLVATGSEHVKYVQGGGAKVIWALQTGRNGNGTAMGAESNYPRASRQSGTQPESNLKSFGKQVRVTKFLMEAAKNNQQAFANGFDKEFSDMKDDFAEDISRQMWLDGSGYVGQVGSSSGMVITLSTTATHRWDPITRPFGGHTEPRVSLIQSAAVVTNSTGYLSAVSQANGTVTLTPDSGSPTITDLDYLVYEGAYGIEMTGLESIIGTASLFGVDPATYANWQSPLVRTTNEDPTETNIARLLKAGQANGGKYNFALTTWGVSKRFATLLYDRKRFGNVEVAGGDKDTAKQTAEGVTFSGPMFEGIGPLVADNWCPQGTDTNTGWLALLHMEDLMIQQTGDPGWDDADGQVIKHLPGTYGLSGNYGAAWRWDAELCCSRRNRFVIHKNLNALV